MGPRRWTAIALVALLAGLAPLLAACGGGGDATGGRGQVVVTTTVLGSIVTELVGGAADVHVLMPNGADPHEFQPSAKDVERLAKADLVVENGLKLEEGLEDALGQARDDGTRIFTATDHVKLRAFGADDAAEIAEHGPNDPHIWTDPLAMRDVVHALVPELRGALGIDVAARGRSLEARLEALNSGIAAEVARLPPERRKLVTGHESLGYFANRYGFRLVGAVLPSLSSQAQVSSSQLATLKDQVRAEGVPVIFNEIGTPPGVAQAVADETGAQVVELSTHTVPDDGSYFTFMKDLADGITRGLRSAGPS
jgi:zinc/manganese transport system substrate-binding protein